MKYTPTVRVIKSFVLNISNVIFEHISIPALITIIALCFWLIALIINNSLSKSKIIKAIPKFIMIFYISFVFEITLISRIGLHYDAFYNVFGDWSIFDTDYYMYINFTPIVNIMLFLPLAPIIYLSYRNIGINNKLLKITALCGFSWSLSIELIQLCFRIGTFQISDLVYNTVGGIFGFLLLLLIKRIYHKRKEKSLSVF